MIGSFFEFIQHLLGICPDHASHLSVPDVWQNITQAFGNNFSAFCNQIALKIKSLALTFRKAD